jgi:uncharacterized integral membrane protein (TIGR00698 family)
MQYWGAFLLITSITLFAHLIHRASLTRVSPLILAVVIGAMWRNLIGLSPDARAAAKLATRPVLRLAIVLLGFQITFTQLLGIGLKGLSLTLAIVALTFIMTECAGRIIGVDAKLTQLIASGTAICGASAIVATNIVTKASDSDVAYAISCITLFGTTGIFVYPLLLQIFGLSPEAYGIWVGASIHEVGQVVAAGYQAGTEAGDIALITKLARVLALGPMILLLGLYANRLLQTRTASTDAPAVPGFVLGFCAAVVLASTFDISQSIKSLVANSANLLLTIALTAIGLETQFSELRARGLRPLILGGTSTVFISAVSYMLLL